MEKICLALFVLLVVHLKAFEQAKVANLLCENKINPTGLSVTRPRLSWQLITPKRNVMQTAYEVKVTSDAASGKAGKEVWSSGRVWSPAAQWQVGLLSSSDWKAKWIEVGHRKTLPVRAPCLENNALQGKKLNRL